MDINTDLPKNGEITRFVGNDEYLLRLRIGELRALQSELNSGPPAILFRLQMGAWMVDDVIEPIRLGLIGGGMSHREAKALVTNYIVDGYLVEYQTVALHLLMAALIGDKDDQAPPGEAPDQTTTTPNV